MLNFAQRFGAVLRMPAWQLSFHTDEAHAVMDGKEAISHGSLRRFSCEQLVVSMFSIAQQLLPLPDPEIELLFDYPEPEYHARYRDRLPRARFSTPHTQVRVPLSYLDLPLRTADQVSALLAERECERELSLLGHNRDLVNQVRAVLINDSGGYPTLEQVAERLHISTRTLNRQLEKRGSGFRELLAEARQRDSLRLLEDPRLTLTDIAQQLGYSSLANFARAFRTWNGTSPGEFRARGEP
jgi:AraC-like DNA-binding protein